MRSYNDFNLNKILSSQDPAILYSLLQTAEAIRMQNIGNSIYLRGLIEYSNYCQCDCLYCGLRKSNQDISRYRLNFNETVDLALQAHKLGMQSVVFQSGEVPGDKTVEFLADVVSVLKEKTAKDGKGGLGITLSVGELTYTQYKRLFASGAHRYLLRIEASNRDLFRKIHPPTQSYEKRLECLDALKDIGYQVGTGVMIGLPGQSPEHLIEDLDFFIKRDIDMLGMGPYLPQASTPLAQTKKITFVDPYSTTLKMMALSRIFMPDINMVASTALQSINKNGLQMGLKAGANIIMPVFTPEKFRNDYCIYDNKEFKPLDKLQQEVDQAGYKLVFRKWGDSRHYYHRLGKPHPELEAPHCGADNLNHS